MGSARRDEVNGVVDDSSADRVQLSPQYLFGGGVIPKDDAVLEADQTPSTQHQALD